MAPIFIRQPPRPHAFDFSDMVAARRHGHHAILGMSATDEWVEKLIDHVWAAIAARPSSPGGA
jgi:hypothetical protein